MRPNDMGVRSQETATAAAFRHEFVVRCMRNAEFLAAPDEYAMQEAATLRLVAAGAPVQREYPLSDRDRPDLIVGDLSTGAVCVECKAAGPSSAVLRQLVRYARHRSVESLVLVTRRASHRDLPVEVLGKPLTVVFTAGVL